MGMMNKIALKGMVICIVMIGLAMTQCEAGSLDKYRSILESRCYTLKYKVTTDSSIRLFVNSILKDARQDNAYIPSGFTGIPKDMEKKLQEKEENRFDVIVMDGDTRYTEMMGKCKLIKNGEVFTYMHYYFDDRYLAGGRNSKLDEIVPGINNWSTIDNMAGYGKKLEKGNQAFGALMDNRVGLGQKPETDIQARGTDNAKRAGYGQKLGPEEIADIGNPMLMKLLAVIYPVSNVNVELPEYSFVSSGQSEDGSIYEDYACETQNTKHVARCYFHNGELVKMAYASYPLNTGVSADDVEKYVIEIKEFSNVPDVKFFSIPSALKVVRK